MCAAIDTTLGAISSGIVHSRVGACDTHGFFAKCVLHRDSYHALANISIGSFIQENMVYECPTRSHFRVRKADMLNYLCQAEVIYVLDKRKTRGR